MAALIFDYSGAAVTHVVTTPQRYYLSVWGGGGGAGRYNAGFNSGGGGFVEAAVDLVAGDVLTFEVGQGGQPGKAGTAPEGGAGGWPDGGWGARGDTQGGGGGGSSRVWLNGTLLAVAGAGGATSGYAGDAGAGGGLEGETSVPTDGGSGGTQTSGGFDKNQPASVPKQGSYLQGGLGTGAVATRFITTTDDGGGGGGGYYGGGGGGGDGRPGGGGSSWGDSSRLASWLTLTGTGPAAGGPFGFYVEGLATGAVSTAAAVGGSAGGNGRIVLNDVLVILPVMVSKATVYTVLQNFFPRISKTSVFTVLGTRQIEVSHSALFAVLREGDPDPIDFEIRVSTLAICVVSKPGANGPLTFVTSNVAEVITGGLATARITHASLEVVHTPPSIVRVSQSAAEVLTSSYPSARVTASNLEVLRSTAEVTVRGWVTSNLLEVMLKPVAGVRTTQVVTEVLISARGEDDDFAVISLMN